MKHDQINVQPAVTTPFVDKLNADFYGKYSYPWSPLKFEYLSDPYFETVMLNQSIGDWSHRVIPKEPRIWVAGCGTNQAIFTALRFPKGEVIGTDLSIVSLEHCAQIAQDIGITNLTLKEESINISQHNEEFDYIISTGVIHHNANPHDTLSRLSMALKPAGILELMVYNYYHRINNRALQQAIDILSPVAQTSGFEMNLALALQLIEQLPSNSPLALWFKHLEGSPISLLADAMIQPIEHTYTIESLEALAASCQLDLLLPCVNIFDKARHRVPWNMDFKDPDLKGHYESLPDVPRWQVTNLLQLDESPMLWFFLQRNDKRPPRKSEKEVCEEFLDATFVKATATQKNYVLRDNGHYTLSPSTLTFPPRCSSTLLKQICEMCNGQISMRKVLNKIQADMSFIAVNAIRTLLTTSAFPYLKTANTDLSSTVEDRK